MIPRKIMLILFSIALMLTFVMPWFVPLDYDVFDFDYLMPGNGIAGYEVNKYSKAISGIKDIKIVKEITGKSVADPIFYLAFLIPAFAVASIVTSLTGTGARLMGIITGSLPLVGFGALLVNYGAALPNHMTYGAFLCLAAGLSLIVASLSG